MIRTFRYPLLPNKVQAAAFERWLVACQRLYNGALEERTSAWKKQHRSVSYNAQTHSLAEIRQTDSDWADRGIFLRALHDKAEEAGRWAIPVDPRGTSQRCSACGAVVSKTLSERVHRCDCGFVADRDHNAALNVLALGRSAVQLTEGSVLN